MTDDEYPDFVQRWTSSMAIYNQRPDDHAIDLAYNALAPYSLDQVSAGLQAHLRDSERGQYPPRPADVIRHIERQDPNQWPTPDEAWAAIPRGEDETALLCDEMAQALQVARPLLTQGDDVAARRAFIDSYQRHTDRARAQGRQPRWWVSPGRDFQQREAVILDAYRRQRITHDQAVTLLPHLDGEELAKGRRRDDGGQALLDSAESKADELDKAGQADAAAYIRQAKAMLRGESDA